VNLLVFLIDTCQVSLSDFDGGRLVTLQEMLYLTYGQGSEIHLEWPTFSG
jgi:hypothetical protein